MEHVVISSFHSDFFASILILSESFRRQTDQLHKLENIQDHTCHFLIINQLMEV